MHNDRFTTNDVFQLKTENNDLFTDIFKAEGSTYNVKE